VVTSCGFQDYIKIEIHKQMSVYVGIKRLALVGVGMECQKMNNLIFNNDVLSKVFGNRKTQATLHSRLARVGEYPFSSSSLHFLTRILLSQNSTKLNIMFNLNGGLPVGCNTMILFNTTGDKFGGKKKFK